MMPAAMAALSHPKDVPAVPTPTEASDAERARALIMTVGVATDPRSDIVEALATDVRSLEPEFLVLIASRQSQGDAKRLRENLGASDEKCRIVRVEDVTSIEEVFRRVNEATEELIRLGLHPSEIAINFTSGTKVMSAGAVIAGVFNRCKELRYLVGANVGPERRRIVKTHPAAVFAFQDLLRARTLARELRLESAQEILEGIDDSLLTERDCKVRREMLLLARAYRARLDFRPALFLEYYEQVTFCAPLIESFKMNEAQIAAARRLASEMDEARIGPHVILEVYNDGRRRLEDGSADEAVSRLYRALEMLAQWVLLRDHEIDTDDVDTRRIPPRDRVGFEALRSIEDGVVKIGLRKAYDLLRVLETPLGEAFAASETMRELLPKRSKSILAHGLHPIDRADARRLFECGDGLLRVEIEDLEDRCRALQFPWLIEKSSEPAAAHGVSAAGAS